MISSYRTVSAVLMIAIFAALMAGCGDVFRPTINVEPKPAPDPASPAQAIVLSTNPAGNGSNTHINVGGDTNVGVVTVGPNPVFLGKNGGRAFVINGNNGVANTVTLYLALFPLSTGINTVTLPSSDTNPVAGGFGGSLANVYIANSGSNNVSLIPSNNVVAAGDVSVGTQPVAIAGNSNSSKVYVVNRGSNNVTVISTVDNTVVGAPIAVGSQPVWGVMSDDGALVFVVNQGGNSVTVIDTATDTAFPALTGFSSPNFAVYDNRLKRVYVSNTGSNTISIIKADVTPPVKLPDITVSGTPTSVAVLPDGTRAYAALGNCPAGINHLTLLTTVTSGGCLGNSVSVIDAVGLRESKVITVGSGAVSIDASSDSTKVYAVNSHDATISIIKTASDSEVTNSSGQPLRIQAPQQSLSCANPSSCPTNVTQIPFMVRTFP